MHHVGVHMLCCLRREQWYWFDLVHVHIISSHNHIPYEQHRNRFGKNGEFAVIVSPTDQGYYEPDTSALIRLKMASEYGYGSTPGTILTDKVNLLGSGALPFWRWIEGSCRTPAGLGKIQANFEKFLVDGRTGKAIRRYPRKYQPYDIADDIAAVVQGRPLPPAQMNFKEEWRTAAKEAEADTYRFQKGLNYFDQ